MRNFEIEIFSEHHSGLNFQPRVGTRPDQNDRPVGVGRVGDGTDRPDYRSEDRKWSVGLLVGLLVGPWSVGRSVRYFTYAFFEIQLLEMSDKLS